MKPTLNKVDLDEVLNYLEDAIQIIDREGKITYYNNAAKDLDDVDIEEAIGRHIIEIYPSLTPESSTLLQVIESGQPILHEEQTFTNYKGDKITTINSTFPIKENNKIIGAIEISRNITYVKKMSEKIIDLQNKLYSNNYVKPKSEKANGFTFLDIISRSDKMLKLKSLALKASFSESPVLVYGETGTGKELFVQAIHNTSPRKNKPLIAQNCAALPANLLEGILFGTTKGGFTGAEDRPGLFELANGGTLFLDEINSMGLELQAKLLRVLQDGSIRRIGSTKTSTVDVRVIAATNTSPEETIKSRVIRKDLFYRLSVINLNLPPLRERKDDIAILTEYFINKYNKKLGRNYLGVNNEVMNIFLNHDWPGNVRELEHVIEGVMSLDDSVYITPDVLPMQFEDNFIKEKTNSLKDAVTNLELQIIKEALKNSNYNITKTAELIDIPRQTLQYKIRKYNIKQY